MLYENLRKYKFVMCAEKVRVSSKQYAYDELTDWVENKKGQIGLIIPSEMIVIDVDDKKTGKKILKLIQEENIECGIHETKKGFHFLFKDSSTRKQKVKAICGLGVEIDTRTSGNNYIVLPVNDSSRSVIKEWSAEAVSVPKYLLPLSKMSSKPNFDSGQRNDQFQKHAWRLIANGYSKDEAKETLNLMNKYILDDPLSSTELTNTVLQDTNLDLATERTKFSFNLFADDLLTKMSIVTINDVIHCYDGGVYKPLDIEKTILDIKPDLKRAQRAEVIDYIKIKTRHKRQKMFMANTRSGFFDRQGNKMDHDEQYIVTTQCDFFYDEDAKDIGIDTFLDDITSNDAEKKQLLLEIIGYCMFDDMQEQKMFILLGEKARNGKSKFLDLVTKLINNVVNVSLSNIASGGFMVPELDGALLNVGADIKTSFINDTEAIKMLTAGDRMTVARKFGQPFQMESFAKFMFSTNRIPDTQADNGFLRRLCIIDFTNQFEENSDFMIENLMHQEALNYLGTISLNAYIKKIKRGEWSYAENQAKLLENYVVQTDNAKAFIVEMAINEGEIAKEVYDKYRVYCHDNGYNPKTKNKFYASLRDTFDIVKKTIGGVTGDRVYRKEK